MSFFFLLLAICFSQYQLTPLHVAAEKGHSKIVEYLVGLTDQEVDINTRDDNGVSIIMCLDK